MVALLAILALVAVLVVGGVVVHALLSLAFWVGLIIAAAATVWLLGKALHRPRANQILLSWATKHRLFPTLIVGLALALFVDVAFSHFLGGVLLGAVGVGTAGTEVLGNR